MSKVFWAGGLICLVLALGLFVGCSDDEGTITPPAMDPAGSIAVYTDIAGTDNNIVDNGTFITLYVVHRVPDGSLGCQFRVEAPTGWTELGTQTKFPVTLGVPATGVSVGYGSCQYDAIHVLSVTYTAPGDTPAGATFKILPVVYPPAQGGGQADYVEVVDCNSNLLFTVDAMESPVTVP